MKFIPQGVTRTIGRQILTAKKHSPALFFGVGVVGVVGGTVLACRATLKLSDTLDTISKEVGNVKASRVDDKVEVEKDVEYQSSLAKVYLTGSFEIVKLYAPAVIVTGASIASLTGSHVILTRRNAALTAAYAALAKGFDEYRSRIREEIGEERELTLYHALEWQDVEGSEGKIQELVTDPGKWSPYVRFFDETSPNWQKQAEYNRHFVQCQQNYANHLLQARGHVFLNEVYDMLGLERSSEGQVVGWVIDGDGDNFLDFGIYEAVNADFLDNREPSIILDFNVDGIIYDKI